MKTADGTVDGTGAVIGSSSADHRNSSGYVLSGPEYLTMFNGQTGKAMQTVDYVPARGTVSSWGDSLRQPRRPLPRGHRLPGRRPPLADHGARLLHPHRDRRLGLARRRLHPPLDLRHQLLHQQRQGLRRAGLAQPVRRGRRRRRQGRDRLRRDGRRRQRQRPVDDEDRPRRRPAPRRPRPVARRAWSTSRSRSRPASPPSCTSTRRTARSTGSWPPCCDNGRGVAGDIWAGNDGAEVWSASDTSIRDEAGADEGPRAVLRQLPVLVGRRPGPRTPRRHPHRQVRHVVATPGC